MTDPERDDEFEAFLRRRSVLPRREAVTEKLEPPDNLDVIVLRKARQAIQASPELPLYKAPRWALPVALAATILLCLSIVLNVSLNTGRHAAPAARLEAARSPQISAPAAKSAPPPAMQEIAVTATRRSAPAANAMPSAAAALPSDAEPSIPAPSAAQSIPAPSADIASPAPAPSPKAWLKRIDRLRAAGQTAAADAEMRRFQAAFPAYPAKPAAPSPSEPPK